MSRRAQENLRRLRDDMAAANTLAHWQYESHVREQAEAASGKVIDAEYRVVKPVRAIGEDAD